MNECKKKIAFFIPTLDGGGAQRVALNLARGLVGLGCEVDLLLVRKEGVLINSIPSGVKVISFEKSRTLYSIPGLVKVLWSREYDTLISFMNYVNICAAISYLLSFKKTPLIITEHKTFSRGGGIKWNWNSILTKILYEQVTSIVSVSKGAANDLKNQLNLNKKVNVIYNPIFLEETFNQNFEKSPDDWFNEHLPVVVSAGRLVPLKGFDQLIEVIKLVNEVMPCRLIILGEGEERSNLEQLVIEKNLVGLVKLPGFSQDILEYISNADLFVLSSYTEALPTVLIEALACGTPIVSTNCPNGPVEILNDGEFGELVEVGNVVAMSNAIIKKLNTVEPLIAKEKRKQRAKMFSVEKISKEYLKLLDSV